MGVGVAREQDLYPLLRETRRHGYWWPAPLREPPTWPMWQGWVKYMKAEQKGNMDVPLWGTGQDSLSAATE